MLSTFILQNIYFDYTLHGRWEDFTDAIVKVLSSRKEIVYLLWGNPAQLKYVLHVALFIVSDVA